MLSGPPLNKPINVSNLLKQELLSKPDELALISSFQRLTWQELDQLSSRLAGHYLSLGLSPGERVASLMPNRHALIIHYLACLKAGLVATPLNYRYQPPEMDHALKVSQASLLVAHGERKPDLAASQMVPHLSKGVVYFETKDGDHPTLEEFLNVEPKVSELPNLESSAPAFIFFTSGSTGKPKGVTHSRETYGWMLASGIKGLEITSGDTLLPGSSLSHLGGQLLSMAGLGAGAPVIVAHSYDGQELLPLLREDRPTLLWMLPAALFDLVRDHGAKREDFGSIKICFSGGDKVSRELEKEFTDLTGFDIEEGYGMTEIGYTSANPPSGPNKLGSMGTLLPGFTLALRDENGKELGVEQEGRLWIQSQSNMVGYWDNPEATIETIQEGWLDTGDMVRVDEEGYLWFCGRKKQIIIHNGSNICPQEVEEALLEHPSVESVGVVGIHDLLHGENVRAYLTIKPEATRPTNQALIQFARERVGYKAPEEIVVLKEMPINPAGKVDRVSLKKMAEQQTHITANKT